MKGERDRGQISEAQCAVGIGLCVCGGDAEARAAYCQMLDALHLTMADPYDISIAYPAIFMDHAELVEKYGWPDRMPMDPRPK